MLEDAGDVPIGGDNVRRWTKRILSYMGEQCPQNLVAYPQWNRRGRKEGEYLVDLVWSREPRGESREPYPWHKYEGLMLAMECEWGGTQEKVWEDLIKLADVRADRRVFVGNLWPREGFDDFRRGTGKLVEGISTFLKNHRHFEASDQLLVALWQKDDKVDELAAWLFDGRGVCRRVSRHRIHSPASYPTD